jgi:hypothetical protein
MDNNGDPTLIGTKDNSLLLRKLRERKAILEEYVKQTIGQIKLIEVDMMRNRSDIPSSEIKCCGHCNPYCPVNNGNGCGCHHQCLKEQCLPRQNSNDCHMYVPTTGNRSCVTCRWISKENPKVCTPPGYGFCSTTDSIPKESKIVGVDETTDMTNEDFETINHGLTNYLTKRPANGP